MTLVELAQQLRPIIEQAAASLDDQTALSAVPLHPKWSKLVQEGRTVTVGFRFQHSGELYKTMQPEYTFVSHYEPGETGTESLFARVDETHAGTYDDPIPYDGNMELFYGLYYSQDGVIYLCIRDSGQPLYHALSALVGLYVEVATE